VRFKTNGKLGAILQLAVLLLVQFNAVAPGLARSLQHHQMTGNCCGNHVRCGCSPERIASRSCCCYLKGQVESALAEKPACCGKSASKEKVRGGSGDLERLTAALSSIPCGNDSAIAPPTENVKFLGVYPSSVVPVAMIAGGFLSSYCSYLSRYIDPPEPPPKPSLFS
jgi:hypothetical protein